MRRISTGLLALLFLTAPLRADVDGLVRDLASKDPDVRRQAASKLAEMGPDAKGAFSALVKSLKDDDVFVRRFSAQALGAIGSEVKGTVPALTAALKDPNKRVIQAAVEALAKTGSEGIKPLTELLKDKKQEPPTRLKIVQALGNAGKDAREAVPVLIDVVKDGGKRNDPMIATLRTEAATALGNIGPDAKEAVETLEQIAGDKMVRDRGLKMAVQQALRKIKK
jgi:HEAT repeat protein